MRGKPYIGANSPNQRPGPASSTSSSSPSARYPHELDAALVDQEGDVTELTLTEQHLGGGQLDAPRLDVGPPGGRQLDHLIGDRQESFVVGGDDDDAPWAGGPPQHAAYLFDVGRVEVGRRFVGQ